MSPMKEWIMWRQLKGAFGIDRFIFTPVQPYMEKISSLEQYESMELALEAAGDGERVFLEPSGYKALYDLPKDDIILILSCAGRNNMHHAHVGETYKIFTPQATDLFGINAASIAFAFWYGQ